MIMPNRWVNSGSANGLDENYVSTGQVRGLNEGVYRI